MASVFLILDVSVLVYVIAKLVIAKPVRHCTVYLALKSLELLNFLGRVSLHDFNSSNVILCIAVECKRPS